MINLSKPKITLYVVLAVVIGLAVWVSLFANHVNSVISSIKDYEFTFPERRLEESVLKVIRADTSLSYKVTRITDNKDGRKYFLDLSYQHNVDKYVYHICLESKNSLFSPKTHAVLHLTGAFNMNEETGGCRKGDKDVPKLIVCLEEMLITKLPER